ncbi:MAG: MaoC/PaaZ C-terminal domain-containing protein [Patulibacter sp.]
MTTTRQLDSTPGAIGLYARAALPMIPGASKLPFVAGSAKTIPDVELVVPKVRIDQDKLAGYRTVCGFPDATTLPVTYPFALAVPLHMALMTAGDFPFPAIGLVHVRNRIVQHRPIDAGESLSVAVRAGNLQPHPKGRTFELTTEFRVGDELVWEGLATIFRRGGGGGAEAAKDDAPDPIDAIEVEPTTPWTIGGDIGRRYAAVSGDINPIHLHPLSAKLLGFPRAIAHGMWTKAHAMASIDGQLPDAYEVEVRFQRPVLLPAKAVFGNEKATDGRIGFALRDADKGTPHLRGLVTPR